MLISGFTIIKNAVINDYPIIEAIASILPVVDEMIVLVGDCKDETKELIRSIRSDKIKMYDSVWDTSVREGGRALAVETDKAFDLVDPSSDWAFYIQADEVIHENYLPAIVSACKKYKNNPQVEGLLFRYLHFYGTYDFVGDSRKWYHREVRIIRNDKSIRAYRDAQGFRKGEEKLKVKPIDAYVYHYGWVKSPARMNKKMKEIGQYWDPNTNDQDDQRASEEIFNYDQFDSLEKFNGSHPEVLKNRISKQNWHINFNLERKRFSIKDKLLYWFEKKTGKRLFSFRNYRII